jgi:hypothetical protein
VPSNRFQLRGRRLDELTAKIRAEHGPRARIIRAERITQGGVGGLFAKRFFEVTVEVTSRERPSAVAPSASTRVSAGGTLADLLAQADASEGTVLGGPAAGGSSYGGLAQGGLPQSRSDATPASFDTVLADLVGRAGLVPLATPAPQPSRLLAGAAAFLPELRAGELRVLVGSGADALPVARTLASTGKALDVRAGGAVRVRTSDPVVDRRSAQAARADAIRLGRGVCVAYGIERGATAAEQTAAVSLRSLGADSVWAVVDASRKHEDTAAWLRALRTVVAVEALAVVGTTATATPYSVLRLGLPIGWSDAPASESG